MAVSITGKERVAAPVATVWAALQDSDILRACLPGCEKLVKTSDREMAATFVFKIGPLKATFLGHVRLSDLDPPRALTITGEGKGGIAGFAKGSADVTLAENGPGVTVLGYAAQLDVGGRIAQLGSRLIDSSARKLCEVFFARLRMQVEAGGKELRPASA